MHPVRMEWSLDIISSSIVAFPKKYGLHPMIEVEERQDSHAKHLLFS